MQINGKNVRLTCKFLPYNCSTKMIGRLALVHDNNHQAFIEPAVLDQHKKELITEFLHWMGDTKNYQQLSMGGNNPLWPSDGGVYPCGPFIYADALSKTGPWYSDFGRLIREELRGGDYGCTVVPGPLYFNQLYNTTPSKLSRIWFLFLDQKYHTGSGKFVLFSDTTKEKLKASGHNLKWFTKENMVANHFTPEEIKEIEKILAAA